MKRSCCGVGVCRAGVGLHELAHGVRVSRGRCGSAAGDSLGDEVGVGVVGVGLGLGPVGGDRGELVHRGVGVGQRVVEVAAAVVGGHQLLDVLGGVAVRVLGVGVGADEGAA